MKILKTVTLVAGATLAMAVSGMAAFAAPAVATTAVNVRSGPGISYAVVDVLLTGQRVNVNRCEENWCFVEKDGLDGWVSSRYLAPASDGSSPDADAAAAEALGAILGIIIDGAPAAPPPPASPPAPNIVSAAQVDLPLNWSINLDTGRAGVGSFLGADISQQGVGANRVIFRQDGALLSLGGTEQRGYAGCAAASYSSSAIPVAELTSGRKTVCVKTNRGNISEFWLIGQRDTTLGVNYVTWRE